MFGNSTVTYTVDPASDGSYSIPWAGEDQPVAMGIRSIVSTDDNQTFTGGDVNQLDAGTVDYIVRYFADNGDKKLGNGDTQIGVMGDVAPSEVGGYWIVAMTKGAKDAWVNDSNPATSMDTLAKQTGIKAQYFEVTARSLEGVQPVYVLSEGDNAFTSEFTYNATDQTDKVGLALDGKLLAEGTDYSMTITNADGANVTTSGVENAGDYKITVRGMGGYKNDPVEVSFTVNPLDLSTATYYVRDFQKGTAVAGGEGVKVNGVDINEFKDDMTWTQVEYQAPGGSIYASSQAGSGYVSYGTNNTTSGGYFFDVTPKTTSGNVVQGSTGEFRINVVDSVDADFTYDGQNFSVLEGAVFDASKGEAVVSVSGKDVTIDGWNASLVENASLESDQFTVVPEAADAAGAYTAIARVNVPADYSVGGSATADFYVVNGIVDANSVDVVVTFNGLNFDFNADKTYETVYTGQPVVPSVSVKDGDSTLVAGTDYTVTYANKANGDAVESMVDAGTYTVTIALADGYVFENATSNVIAQFDVEIAKRALEGFDVVTPAGLQDDPDVTGSGAAATTVPFTGDEVLYTGSAIEPSFVAYYDSALTGEPVEVALDPSWYTVSSLYYADEASEAWVPVTEIRDAGSYKLALTPTSDCVNYTWNANVQEIFVNVVEKAVFADVAADQWYADEVAQAASNGYVNGVGDTNLFMPDNDIDRAALAQVMFNMAGETSQAGIAYPTPFSDVPELAWFAQPVAWATEAGVVTGMGDTGTFAPYDNATREQVATMFCRYAKAQGMDVSGAADLSGYADDEAVSGWAEQAVAWAVEAGIFGQGTDQLRPSDPISRAEVAAMAVRLQPERVAEPAV